MYTCRWPAPTWDTLITCLTTCPVHRVASGGGSTPTGSMSRRWSGLSSWLVGKEAIWASSGGLAKSYFLYLFLYNNKFPACNLTVTQFFTQPSTLMVGSISCIVRLSVCAFFPSPSIPFPSSFLLVRPPCPCHPDLDNLVLISVYFEWSHICQIFHLGIGTKKY